MSQRPTLRVLPDRSSQIHEGAGISSEALPYFMAQDYVSGDP